MINGKKLNFLIVDDDKEIVRCITEHFSQFNTKCVQAFNLLTAIKHLKNQIFDFVLLDLNLPDGSGLQFIEEAQKTNFNGSIIILSGKNSVLDKIVGLNTGSDEFLAKPFSLEVLTARIRNLYRSKERTSHNIITFHEIILHTNDHRAYVNSDELKLTRTEFDLLFFLVSNAKKILTRETIGRYLYLNKYCVEDSFDFIYSHIKNLKKKIAQHSHRDYLKTVYGIGYLISQE